MNISLTTEDKLEYNFFPVYEGHIQFQIKAPHDAHIALTSGPYESDPMWEVFIGGWKNSKSVIRKNRTKPDVTEADTPHFLSHREFRGFWIKWSGGYLSVGKEGEREPFMRYLDPHPFPITHYGVCTGWGASGAWRLEAKRPPTMPSHYQTGGSSSNWYEARNGPMPHGVVNGGQGVEQIGRRWQEHLGTGVGQIPTAPSYHQIGRNNYYWCKATKGFVPPGAVLAGEDGEPLYVARANHDGDLLPGKLQPSHRVCYVSYHGKEHPKSEYEVLCNCEPTWVPASGGNIPPNAIPAGHTEDGETLFVGRAKQNNRLTPGKVHPSHGNLYIPYGGNEVAHSKYEILTN